MTETEIQNIIWYHYINKSSLLIVPNSNVLGWESDLIVVTKSLIVHEFEIKTAYSDFQNDGSKDKFQHFERFLKGERKYTEWSKFGYSYDTEVIQPPNYFWYVCPENLIHVLEITNPFYGLVYVPGFNVIKKPVKLHNEKLGLKGLYQLCGSMNIRYWRTRFPHTDFDLD